MRRPSTRLARLRSRRIASPAPRGRAVFAADGRVLHEADLPGPPRCELARWAPLPDLLPLLAQLPEYAPHVVVRLGRLTATITGVDRVGQEVFGVTDQGVSHPVHKARAGGPAHYKHATPDRRGVGSQHPQRCSRRRPCGLQPAC